MMRNRGFTLIELLVVISIIAILMAILMPGLQRVKEQARYMACRSNLRTYAVVGRMYADDYDGNFPYSFEWLFRKDIGQQVGCNWHDETKNLDQHPEFAGLCWPYLKGQPKIHLCHAFNQVVKMKSCYICTGSKPIKPQYGYTMNSYLNGDAFKNLNVPAQYKTNMINETLRKETQVRSPSLTFYFSEENSWRVQGINNAGINDTNLRPTPGRGTDSFGTFHKTPATDLDQGVVNASFVDGHVEEVDAWADDALSSWHLAWPGNKPAPIF